MKFGFGICLILLVLLCNSPRAIAGTLSDRLVTFPDWQQKPSLLTQKEDLIYPDWMAGTWEVTSTQIEAIAL